MTLTGSCAWLSCAYLSCATVVYFLSISNFYVRGSYLHQSCLFCVFYYMLKIDESDASFWVDRLLSLLHLGLIMLSLFQCVMQSILLWRCFTLSYSVWPPMGFYSFCIANRYRSRELINVIVYFNPPKLSPIRYPSSLRRLIYLPVPIAHGGNSFSMTTRMSLALKMSRSSRFLHSLPNRGPW